MLELELMSATELVYAGIHNEWLKCVCSLVHHACSLQELYKDFLVDGKDRLELH